MLTSRYAMWLGWGPDLAFLYNDAYAHMTLGAKHPWALGRPAQRSVGGDLGAASRRASTRCSSSGEATWDEALLLFLERNGYPEETYHTFSYSPLPDDAGDVAGNFCVVTEETERVIGERRLASLRNLAAGLAHGDDRARGVRRRRSSSIAEEPRDLPFALIYLFDEAGAERAAGRAVRHSPRRIRPPRPSIDIRCARRALAVRAGDRAAPGIVTVDLDPAGERRHSRPARGTSRRRARWSCRSRRRGRRRPSAVFVAGLNPYRPLDETYRSFVGLFVGQIAAGLANARATRRSGGAPRRSPRSIARRPRSSPTSATSSGRR